MIEPRMLTLSHQLAVVAGDIVRRYWRSRPPVEHKADNSPVTLADQEAELAMRKLIEETFPEHGIVGEEHGNVREDAPWQWVLDPIDGTRAFIAGIPTFTTLIALAKDGVPVLGIIDQPVTSERWLGIHGVGSTCNGRPITTRPVVRLADAVLATTSTNYFEHKEEEAFAQLRQQCGNTMLDGDAYAYGMLASGKMDIVVDVKLQPYDYCALKPVIEGAGGVITDWKGRPVTIDSDGKILAAANPTLHALALTILQST